MSHDLPHAALQSGQRLDYAYLLSVRRVVSASREGVDKGSSAQF